MDRRRNELVKDVRPVSFIVKNKDQISTAQTQSYSRPVEGAMRALKQEASKVLYLEGKNKLFIY